MHISWQSPSIRGLQSDCRYVNNNDQITCRSHARALVRTAEMELPLMKRTVEPLRIQRVIADVARDLGYESLTTEQTDGITAFLRGREVLVCLPTGSGKSLCFALFPKVGDALKAAVGV